MQAFNTIEQADLLESIQERTLKKIHPDATYLEALALANLEALSERRKKLCEKLFVAAQNPQHRLFPLLPPFREATTSHRDFYHYQVPLVHTNRFRDTFVNYCLAIYFVVSPAKIRFVLLVGCFGLHPKMGLDAQGS